MAPVRGRSYGPSRYFPMASAGVPFPVDGRRGMDYWCNRVIPVQANQTCEWNHRPSKARMSGIFRAYEGQFSSSSLSWPVIYTAISTLLLIWACSRAQ